MNEIIRLHDDVLLHFVETDYFGRPWLEERSFCCCCSCAVHRRAARMVMALASLWVLITIGFYDAFRQVPVLGCVTVLAVIASWSRWICGWCPSEHRRVKPGLDSGLDCTLAGHGRRTDSRLFPSGILEGVLAGFV